LSHRPQRWIASLELHAYSPLLPATRVECPVLEGTPSPRLKPLLEPERSILFTGRYPRGMFEFVDEVIRWHNRVIAYAFVLVTDEYPPFRHCCIGRQAAS
jgi:hypothetical protein